MPSKKKEEKGTAIDLAMTQIERQHGKGAIMRLGSSERLAVDVIPTGALALDIALGVGGVPRGLITEIYGNEGSGKTTLAYHLIAEAQREGGTAAYIDAEQRMDPSYAQVVGVDLDGLLISQPQTGEQALDIADILVRSGGLDIFVVDSVAALVPRAELEGEMGDSHVGLQARLMSKALRKVAHSIRQSNTAGVFLNQIREKIGVMFGNPEVTPGGRALKFWSSVRIELRRVESLKRGTEIIGGRSRARLTKNSVAPPFRRAEFDIMYGRGISRAGNLLDKGLELEVISKSGAFLSYGDTRLGQGRENARSFLEENADVADEIEAEVRQRAGLAGKPAKAEDDEKKEDQG
ncbi:MAG: recombinase RecA [Armatimonadota bacterium]|nr:MAG: recombinase RecA [Armatimonadota bacterium]